MKSAVQKERARSEGIQGGEGNGSPQRPHQRSHRRLLGFVIGFLSRACALSTCAWIIQTGTHARETVHRYDSGRTGVLSLYVYSCILEHVCVWTFLRSSRRLQYTEEIMSQHPPNTATWSCPPIRQDQFHLAIIIFSPHNSFPINILTYMVLLRKSINSWYSVLAIHLKLKIRFYFGIKRAKWKKGLLNALLEISTVIFRNTW